MIELDKVVYLETPVSREVKDDYHKKGYKVLPLEMKPADEDKPKPRKPKDKEAEL